MTNSLQKQLDDGPVITDFHNEVQIQIESAAQRILFMESQEDIKRAFRSAYGAAFAYAYHYDDDADIDAALDYADALVIALGKRLGELRKVTH